jgi:ATP-dependent DNA helicase RecG
MTKIELEKYLKSKYPKEDHTCEYKEFKTAKRVDFGNILLDKLPDILDINQKKNKIKNNLQALKKADKIENIGKVWQMSKS